MTRAGARHLALLLGLAPLGVRAAVVAPPPGQDVVLVEEAALVVYDPLTASQTIVVQHTFEGTATPFGLLIPTPKPARVSVAGQRLQNAIRNRLHPRGRVRRTLEVQFTSWAGGCAIREVGDGLRAGSAPERPPAARGQASNLGNAPEPIHDWLLTNGFTIAPAQAAWLSRLRAHGWSVVGVVVQPAGGGSPPPRLRGPVLAITHAAEDPSYAAGHPSFAITDSDALPRPVVELAVLTEWAVSLDAAAELVPFYADGVSGRDVARMSNEAGGLPWAFRRDGTLTAFQLERTSDTDIVRFIATDQRPTTKPSPTPRVRAHRIEVPVELLLLGLLIGFWAWLRHWRRSPRSARMRGSLG